MSAVARLAAAQTAPTVLTHQGFLLGTDDGPVDRTGVPMAFRLYDRDAGQDSQLAWQGSCNVDVSKGRYAVTLGGSCGTGLEPSHFAGVRWLEVSIEGLTLTPRLRLGDVASALSARTLEGLSLAQLDTRYRRTATALDWATLENVPADLADGDDVGVSTIGVGLKGTGTPDSPLEVDRVPWGRLEGVPPAIAAGEVGLKTVTVGAGLDGEGTGAKPLVITSVAWSKLSGVPAGLDDGDDTGLAKVAIGTGLTGEGTLAKPLALDPSLSALQGVFTSSGSFLGVGSASPVARLDVAGGVRIGQDPGECTAARAGTIRFTGTAFEGCAGGAWLPISSIGNPCEGYRIAGQNKCVYDYTGKAETFTVMPGMTAITVKAWGAGGGGGNGAPGAPGGFATARVDVTGLAQLAVIVGQGGRAGQHDLAADQVSTFGDGGSVGGGSANSTTLRSGLGGGLTGVFAGSKSQANALVIAGGGGGGGSFYSTFGSNTGFGGGSTGQAGGLASTDGGYNDVSMYTSARVGGGGTQSAGGSAGSDYGGAGTGTAFNGGRGGSYNGAGGGGGYYGGGGSTAYANGGGGSGFFHATRVTAQTFAMATVDRSSNVNPAEAPRTNDADWGSSAGRGGTRWSNGGGTASNGRLVITW